MFGKRNVINLVNRTEEKVPPSPFYDSMFLVGICAAFGVLGWYLVQPIIGS